MGLNPITEGIGCPGVLGFIHFFSQVRVLRQIRVGARRVPEVAGFFKQIVFFFCVFSLGYYLTSGLPLHEQALEHEVSQTPKPLL